MVAVSPGSARDYSRGQARAPVVRAHGLSHEIVSACGIDARGEPAAVCPGGEIRADELRDPRLVGGEVGGGETLAPLAGSAATEEGAHVLPVLLRRVWRDVGTALAHPGQTRLRRERSGMVRRARDAE